MGRPKLIGPLTASETKEEEAKRKVVCRSKKQRINKETST